MLFLVVLSGTSMFHKVHRWFISVVYRATPLGWIILQFLYVTPIPLVTDHLFSYKKTINQNLISSIHLSFGISPGAMLPLSRLVRSRGSVGGPMIPESQVAPPPCQSPPRNQGGLQSGINQDWPFQWIGTMALILKKLCVATNGPFPPWSIIILRFLQQGSINFYRSQRKPQALNLEPESWGR